VSRVITRRNFIKGGVALGASSILHGNAGGWLQNAALAAGGPDIAAVKGADHFQSTIKAVDFLGGINKFVPRQSRVGLLINSGFYHPGSFVKPEITLAVIHMCLEAGAREIGVFLSLSGSYWRRSPLSQKDREQTDRIESIGGGF
jgi:hypothetical protein